jgi:hypothetical protein
LAAKDYDLMPERQDLGDQHSPAAGEQRQPTEDLQRDQVEETYGHAADHSLA